MGIKILFEGAEYDVDLVEWNGEVQAWCGDKFFGMITTNLQEPELKDGEYYVRLRSEPWIGQFLDAGVFETTGRSLQIGIGSMPVWRRGPRYTEVLRKPR